MKKCPSCEKTFEDSMRFCQVDGTPLIDDAPAFDPYATIVAPAGSAAPPEPEPPAAVEPPVMSIEPIETAESEAATQIADYPQTAAPIAEPDDVLDLPSEPDPLKTMYVSEDEMRAALGSVDAADDQIMEIPEAAPEPPAFIAPEIATPPSPFAAETPSESVFAASEPAIPSPFGDQAPVAEEVQTPQFSAPEPPPFKEPEPAFAPSVAEPAASSPPAEWTPPPAPDASWQNQEIGSNTPFQQPPVGAAAPSSVLAIISLVSGVIGFLSAIGILIPLLGVLCALVTLGLGLAAIITGFLARSRANRSPDQYGGKGLATAGIILGVLDLIAPFVIYGAVFLLMGGMSAFSR